MAYLTLKEKLSKKEISLPSDEKKVDIDQYIKKLHVRDPEGVTWTVEGREGDKFILRAVVKPKKPGIPAQSTEKAVTEKELKDYELA